MNRLSRRVVVTTVPLMVAGCIFIDPFDPLGQEPAGAVDAAVLESSSSPTSPTSPADDGAAPCKVGSTRACYSGPASARGIGACTEGVETCLPDGGYSACQGGDVRPAAERCSTTTDESCDGVPACTGDPRGALAFGDGEEQEGLGIAVDEASIFVVGHYGGALPLSTSLTLPGSGTAAHDGFISAFDHDRHAKWGLSLRDGQLGAVAVGPSFVVAAGFIEGPSEIAGCGSLAHDGAGGHHDAVIAVFSKTGTCLRARSFGDAKAQDFTSVAIDPTNGDIVVGGHFLGTIDFGGDLGGGQTLTQVGPRDGFGVRFDAELKTKEVFHLKGGSVTVNAVAVSSAGKIAIGGSFVTRIDLGEQWETALGGYDAFIATPPFLGSYYAERLVDVRALAFDPAGTLVAAGTFTGRVFFNGGTGMFESAGDHDIYVARYAVPQAGTLATVTTAGARQREYVGGIAIDPAGNVVVAGEYTGFMTVGPKTFGADAGSGMFAAKYEPDAALAWSHGYDLPRGGARSVATNAFGEVFVTGAFSGAVDFGGDAGPIVAAGPSAADVFVLKRAP